MKTALITGANGMDAKTLTYILLSKGYRVILTYRRNTYFQESEIRNLYLEELQKYNCELHFELCDITDQDSVNNCLRSVIQKYDKIDEIYLLAALSHVGNSFKQREYSILANGQSYYYFLEFLKNCSKNTRVYGAMTSELAGNVPNGTIFNEDTIWNPKSPYSIGKALGGHWLKFYRESKDSELFCCFGILFNHSNTFRSSDFLIRKCSSTAAKIALGQEKELRLGHLNFARDEHWSDFGCEMMWKMLQQDSPEDYVIATGETHWGEEYVDLAFSYFNLDWKKFVVFDNKFIRPNEVVRLVGDSSKAQEKLGWNPKRMSFKNHIELLCGYDYKLNLDQKPKRPKVLEFL